MRVAYTHKGKVQLAYLAPGEALQAPINTGVKSGGMFTDADADVLKSAYVDPAGNVYEIDANPRGMHKVGKAAGHEVITNIWWNEPNSKWLVKRLREDDVLVP